MENKIAFLTSNRVKIANIRHICRDYDLEIIPHKELFYGYGYKEPQLFERDILLQKSIESAIKRWEKFVSPNENKLFFIEDTSVVIDSLSTGEREVPGVDVKYWMQNMTFELLDNELKSHGGDRSATVYSHVVLYLTKDLRDKFGITDKYKIFSSKVDGHVSEKEYEIETNILFPWLDDKTFNKWFIPNGYDKPMSLLSIDDYDKCDFRKGAVDEMILFLIENKAINVKKEPEQLSLPILNDKSFVMCGPTCAGKTTIGRFLLEEYNYFHIEASDFMSIIYLETLGPYSDVDKHIFASELLKTDPCVIAKKVVSFIKEYQISEKFVITGFRNLNEVEYLIKYCPILEENILYVDAARDIRFNRWKLRCRDKADYTEDRFIHLNALQNEMGLSGIYDTYSSNSIINEGTKEDLFGVIVNKLAKNEHRISRGSVESYCPSERMSLENSILLCLASEYQKDSNKYLSTTEISHTINTLYSGLNKNKNNISRYFNQCFRPFYEIRVINSIVKYKLSPLGYSYVLSRLLTKVDGIPHK